MNISNSLANFVSESTIYQQPLRKYVEVAINRYFIEVGDVLPIDLYELVLAEIEPPLLEVVMRKTRGNQTKAAQILGLSRGTLRKKLEQYHFIGR